MVQKQCLNACLMHGFDMGIYRTPVSKVFNLLTITRANKLAHNFLAMNRQPLELESCSNPLRIQQVFQSKSKTKFFSILVWGSLGGPPQVEVFLLFQPPLAGPGPQPIGPFFWLKILLETKPKSASLEPLNDFLAELQRKLWTKHQKLVKILAPTNLSLWWKSPLFSMANSRQRIELESCSNPP